MIGREVLIDGGEGGIMTPGDLFWLRSITHTSLVDVEVTVSVTLFIRTPLNCSTSYLVVPYALDLLMNTLSV